VRAFKSCAFESWELPDRFKMVLALPCLAVFCACLPCLAVFCACLVLLAVLIGLVIVFVGSAVAHEAVENVIENRSGFRFFLKRHL
jgi:hypothetical protein